MTLREGNLYRHNKTGEIVTIERLSNGYVHWASPDEPRLTRGMTDRHQFLLEFTAVFNGEAAA